jgi:hypothetical protein
MEDVGPCHVAAASSDERKFAHPDHDIYALCHTRARNRAILGILGLGEVSFEEMSSDRPITTAGSNTLHGEPSLRALDELPWKPMTKNPNGAWIYSNLPGASALVEALAKSPDKTLTVGSFTYTISGTDGKFVNRFPRKEAVD